MSVYKVIEIIGTSTDLVGGGGGSGGVEGAARSLRDLRSSPRSCARTSTSTRTARSRTAPSCRCRSVRDAERHVRPTGRRRVGPGGLARAGSPGGRRRRRVRRRSTPRSPRPSPTGHAGRRGTAPWPRPARRGTPPAGRPSSRSGRDRSRRMNSTMRSMPSARQAVVGGDRVVVDAEQASSTEAEHAGAVLPGGAVEHRRHGARDRRGSAGPWPRDSAPSSSITR